MPLLVFEFFGTTEMLLIALVALIIFGPRKLPELGRSLGKSIGEFKRASEDFKRTWEREVEVERIERDLRIDREVKAALSTSSAPSALSGPPDDGDHATPANFSTAAQSAETEQTIARAPSQEAPSQTVSTDAAEPAAAPTETVEPAGKQEWL